MKLTPLQTNNVSSLEIKYGIIVIASDVQYGPRSDIFVGSESSGNNVPHESEEVSRCFVEQ